MMSHRSFVADIKFIPKGIKVDRKNPSEGHVTHVISVAEDGCVNIWDTRTVSRDKRVNSGVELLWKPFL